MKSLYIFLAGAVLVSCKKDADPAASRAEMLKINSWALTSYIDETTGQAPLQRFQPCDADDSFRFEDGDRFREERGANRCTNETAGATSLGTWAIRANGDSVTISGVAGDGLILRNKWRISELTDSRLTLSRTTTGATTTRTSTVQLQKK